MPNGVIGVRQVPGAQMHGDCAHSISAQAVTTDWAIGGANRGASHGSSFSGASAQNRLSAVPRGPQFRVLMAGGAHFHSQSGMARPQLGPQYPPRTNLPFACVPEREDRGQQQCRARVSVAVPLK